MDKNINYHSGFLRSRRLRATCGSNPCGRGNPFAVGFIDSIQWAVKDIERPGDFQK
jgi:hypothetical protein